MPTLVYDTSLRFVAGENGNEWIRGYVVEDLVLGPDVPTLIDEIYDLMPDSGTPAPLPVINMYIRDVTIERISQVDTARWEAAGIIRYTTPAPAGGASGIGVPDDNGIGVNISSTSTIEEITTDKDINGTQLVTQYDNVIMAHSVQTFRVARSFAFRRIELNSPRTRQNNYEGRLNNALWNGYPALTVLLQTIDWSTDDLGASYVVDYTFAYRPDGWRVEVVHEDPLWPGNPLPGATGFARTEANMLETANFGDLNIILP